MGGHLQLVFRSDRVKNPCLRQARTHATRFLCTSCLLHRLPGPARIVRAQGTQPSVQRNQYCRSCNEYGARYHGWGAYMEPSGGDAVFGEYDDPVDEEDKSNQEKGPLITSCLPRASSIDCQLALPCGSPPQQPHRVVTPETHWPTQTLSVSAGRANGRVTATPSVQPGGAHTAPNSRVRRRAGHRGRRRG